ncbi:MAG: hypothetical protein WC003_02825 [Terrimicrobiaceae bacterium]
MRFPGAVLVFVAVSVSSAVALAFPCGGISSTLAWTAFAIGLAASVLAWRSIKSVSSPRPNAWDVLMLTLFALASLRAFLWLIYPVGDEWRVLSPNNLGDISLHIHLIRYLAGGVDFWPASPILSGTPLVYPIGYDLLNSLLFCTGVPVERGLVWAGLAGAVLTGWALWRWGGAFAIAAFLFNGGLAGFVIFQTHQIADFQAELAWKNFFLSMLVTQRGLLYALPCGLFLLCAWREDFFRDRSGVSKWITFLLYATMPIFSVHAFLFLSLVLAVAFVVHPPTRRKLLIFVGSAIIPASVAMYFVTGKFSAASGIRWLPGWMQADGGLGFWIWNFGISLPLLLLLAWKILRQKAPETMCFAGTGISVFVICCLFSFSQWEWDNTKLMLWAWLACTPFLWTMIATWPPLVRPVVCFALFFSGALSLAGGLDTRHGYKLASRTELAEAGKALEAVPIDARIAVKPDFNNPVILLGRPVLCGYEGHLWSHGLNYRRQWNALQHALQKNAGWQEELHRLGTDWLFVQGPPPVVIATGQSDSSL